MAVTHFYKQSSSMKCRVVKINKKKIVSKSPEGLNTVALLRTASLALGISPKKCMDVAEKLYIAGYITYPRTESTKYPKSMEYLKIVDKFRGSNITFITSVLPEDNSNISLPRSGIDRGDHPPICPTTKIMRVGQHGWNLYEFIVRNFLASLLPPFVYNEITVTVDVLEETLKKQQRGKKRSRRMPKTSFSFVYHTIVSSGWSNLLPWRVKAMRLNTNVKNCKSLQTNDVGHVKQIVSESNWTKPPEYLKEYELIDAMDKFDIGTDASIPTHVETIVNRGYVKICEKENEIVKGAMKLPPRKDASSSSKNNRKTTNNRNAVDKRKGTSSTNSSTRYMVPTSLGIAVISAFELIDKDLILPTLRGNLEKHLVDIANGTESKDKILLNTLQTYFEKYRRFAKSIDRIRTHFISKEAAYKMLEQTTSMRNTKLSNLSDYEIRKLEEKEDRVSAIVSHYEKIRLEEDRKGLKDVS